MFLIGQSFIFNVSKVKINFDYNDGNTTYKGNTVILENVISNEFSENVIQSKTEDKIWRLEIPKIDLTANIEDGTTEDILNRNIGHFIESEYVDGNIALAAHNRGYDVNYFSRIKELQIGDEVIYTYGDLIRKYKVISKDVIKDTNVEVLENTENKENILTLITCVENMPELRRCIKCEEVK